MKMQEKASLAAYLSPGFLVQVGKVGKWFNDLTLNDWAIVIGIIIAIATFAANIYFQRRQTRAIEEASLSGAAIIPGHVK
ncbi:TPA: phage holin [Serratia liquefaciens]